MLVALLLMWGATNKKILVRCFLSYVPLFLAVLFAEHGSSRPTIDFPGSWFIGFLLVLAGNLFLLDTFIKARKERVFFERSNQLAQLKTNNYYLREYISHLGWDVESHEGIVEEFSDYEPSPIDEHLVELHHSR